MDYSREIIDFSLREKGYECESRDGLYIFKRIINPDDMPKTLEECFGEGRKVYAITADALLNLSFQDLLDKLDRMDW